MASLGRHSDTAPLQATEAEIDNGFDLIAEALRESGLVVQQFQEAVEPLLGLPALSSQQRLLPAMRFYGGTDALHSKTFKMPDFELVG